MISQVTMSNTGPASELSLNFAPRLNLLTGDNGLGKSFVLDVVWWALTRRWPAEINTRLISGKKALPSSPGKATISFSFSGTRRKESYESIFNRREQTWRGRIGRPENPGLVVYAMADGSFAVWDPHRNYWRTQGEDGQERVLAYVFSPNEVWDGLQNEKGDWLCNGLIRDWVSWQQVGGEAFTHLAKLLDILSPSSDEKIQIGEVTRLGLNDVRDIPTIRMPYQQEVAVVLASAGMRRIIALAYFLVWTWEEHKRAARQLDEPTTQQLTFLIDELEAHLHPTWQRRIVPALLSVMKTLSNTAQIQLIAATHSPLIMASVEPTFHPKYDAWFDFDLVENKVVLTQRDFEKHGDVESWLVSEAFDLKSSRPIEYEKLVADAALLINKENPSKQEIIDMNDTLVRELGPKDSFLFRWRAICDKKGWLHDSCYSST